MFHPAIVLAALLALAPFLTEAFLPGTLIRARSALPPWLQAAVAAALCIPYLLVAWSSGTFRWCWLLVYALLPVVIAGLLLQARRLDPGQRGTWRDFLVLATVGLAVDLRWLQPAWPARLAVFNKVLLLDAGIYGFAAVRQLQGVGFDLRVRARDLAIALREWAFYAPVAVSLGLALGFLHLHPSAPWRRELPEAFLFTFFFIAVPEEVFFRGWLQNLLETRLGRFPALLCTAALFGLSHFNKRAARFNWPYVVLAFLAGIFYGRAWRQDRRVAASAITHAAADSVWSVWLR